MQLKLENLDYQTQAIQAVTTLFQGNIKNTAENASKAGTRFNLLNITTEQLTQNKAQIIQANGISADVAKIDQSIDVCIEMETGTGKTLVYIKTIYELFQQYGFTKFIILVPSIAIRKGVVSSFSTFKSQLEYQYGFSPKAFEYESKNLIRVTEFVQSQHPAVMVMTLASFNSEDKILNQAQREDLLDNLPFIDSIAATQPIIVMDEPQEGMDTENAVNNIARLNPLVKLRYSATHRKEFTTNLLYRLTPFDSYQQGMVKKIEVMSIVERNAEAALKIEFSEVKTSSSAPQVKLKAWLAKQETFEFKTTNWLKEGDNLGQVAKNPSYENYTITRIFKDRFNPAWQVVFSNGVTIAEHAASGNLKSIWEVQIASLIKMHFHKAAFLKPKGIKCLSLFFIDKVANYMGEEPIIKQIFIQKFREIYPQYHGGKSPTDEEIQAVQGYYFAQKASGEYADNEGGQKEQTKIYDLILKKRDELLSLDNPVQFIFSHTALGVGWDNPNVFNIATLSTTYSEVKKRQEIGRGLRLCVNQQGERVRDKLDVSIEERVNLLTVFPNESYETFVGQYQSEIKATYGNETSGADITKNNNGVRELVKLQPNPNVQIKHAIKQFWQALACKTEYVVAFDEVSLIQNALVKLNSINMADAEISITSNFIQELRQDSAQAEYLGNIGSVELKAEFAALDIIEEISEQTGLAYNTVLSIFKRLDTPQRAMLAKNPPKFTQQALQILRQEMLDNLVRGLTYAVSNETLPFDFDTIIEQSVMQSRVVETPNKGVYDKMVIDSQQERNFALEADNHSQSEVVCFLKLPSYYKIPVPKIFNQDGYYEPDFAVVLKQKDRFNADESSYHFVVEIKGTRNIDDVSALTPSERFKIQCAQKHFAALGIQLNAENLQAIDYIAPVDVYQHFKTQALNQIKEKQAAV